MTCGAECFVNIGVWDMNDERSYGQFFHLVVYRLLLRKLFHKR